MKTIIVIFMLLCTIVSHASNRDDFKNVIDQVANYTQSNEPLQCAIFVPGKINQSNVGVELYPYPNPGFVDAFMIMFESKIFKFSTLVAYERDDNTKLGELFVSYSNGSTVYKHVFDGLYDDTIEVSRNDESITFNYSKAISTNILMSINCTPIPLDN